MESPWEEGGVHLLTVQSGFTWPRTSRFANSGVRAPCVIWGPQQLKVLGGRHPFHSMFKNCFCFFKNENRTSHFCSPNLPEPLPLLIADQEV